MKLAELRKLALSLPEVSEQPHFHRISFRVRGRIIATAVPDEPFANVMVGESVREPMLSMYPDCIEKLFWGAKVVGVRVDLRRADSDVVADLLEQAWREKAPKSLPAASRR